ncbi:MAG TPA: glycine cleavage system aminomethyltransferase GcvT [Candidatus Nanopelagicales bacterium]|jgi:aminomethyltransferase|nr:glycine cleavage system aminomethyltransferase GcvT [Candidatus Nanopelagicales bacterium]
MSELLQSPIHQRHVDLDAKLGDFGGWSMPLEYGGGGVVAEHTAVREHVGVFDVSHLGTVVVRGPGAADYLNTVLTNELARIEPGKAQYTLLCEESGGVVDDLIVYLRSPEELLLVPNAANTPAVVQVLRTGAPAGVEVLDEHRDHAVLAVQGPDSVDTLTGLGLPTELSYMAFTDVAPAGRPVVVCRTGYTGEHGYELVVPWDDAGRWWDALLGAGARPCGLGARDTLRTEMGYPLHGHELTRDITPVQARAGWAVGWDKPAFHGREALIAERAAGPDRRSWGLLALERAIPRAGMAVLAGPDGGRVGEVTSGTFSPTLGQGIALALLDTSAGLEVGDEVAVDVRGRPRSFRVVRPPFVDRSTR